jgi:hypothetical protein
MASMAAEFCQKGLALFHGAWYNVRNTKIPEADMVICTAAQFYFGYYYFTVRK